jgi:hypothetical protein
VAQASGSNLSWYICGWSFVTPLNSEMACSMDGGKTWSARPLLRTCETCPPIPFLGARICITSDGSLLALDQRYPSWFLYRLPAHSSQWQYLGQLPDEDFDMSLIFAPAPSSAGGGYLWLLSSYGMTGKFFTATEPA